MKIGDLSVDFATIITKAVERHGIDSQALLKEYKLSLDQLAVPNSRISIPHYMRLGHAAIEQTGVPWLGLEFGSLTQLSFFGVSGACAMASPTLGTVMETLNKYQKLTSHNIRGTYTNHFDGTNWYARFYSLAPYNSYNYFVVDAYLSGWLKNSEWVTGETNLLREVHIEYKEPKYAEEFEKFFNCPVLFGQEYNQLLFQKSVYDLPSLYAAPSAYQSCKILCDQALENYEHGHTLPNQVQDTLSQLLHKQTPTIEDVAKQLSMSPWTLRRKLQALDMSFQGLLNKTRQSLAETYIKHTNYSFGEIAFLLGFSSQAAFQRAFKRWTGENPGQYRKQALQQEKELLKGN